MERQWPNGTVVLEDGKRQLPYIYPEEDDPDDEEIVPRPPLPPEQRCYQEESMSGAPLRNTRQLLYFYLPDVRDRFMCYAIEDILSIMKVERRLTEELNHGIQGDDDDMFFRFPHNQMRVRMAEMEQAIRTRRNTFRLIREDLPLPPHDGGRGIPPPIYHLEPIIRVPNVNRIEGETDQEFERRVAESRIQVWEQPEVNNERRARLNEMIQRFRRVRLVNNLNNIEGMIQQRLQEDADPLILLEDAEDLEANIRLLERAQAIGNAQATELIERAIDRLSQNRRGILDALEHPELFIDLLQRVRQLRDRETRIRFERILHPVSPNWMEIQDDIRREEERQLHQEPIVPPPRGQHLPLDFRAPPNPNFRRRFNEAFLTTQRLQHLGLYLERLDIHFSDQEIQEMQEDPALRWNPRRLRQNRLALEEFIHEPTLERWLLISEQIYHVRYRFGERFNQFMARAQENLPDEFAHMIDNIIERANEGHNLRSIELVEIEALLLPESHVQRRIGLLREYFQHLMNLNRDRFDNDPRINEFIVRISDLLRDEPSRLLSLESILTRLMLFMYSQIRRNAPNRIELNDRQRNETIELLGGLIDNSVGMLGNELVVLEELVTDGLIIQEDLDRIAEIGGANQNRFVALRERVQEQIARLQQIHPQGNGVEEHLIAIGREILGEIGDLEGIEFEVQNNRVERFEHDVEQALIINILRRLDQLQQREIDNPPQNRGIRQRDQLEMELVLLRRDINQLPPNLGVQQNEFLRRLDQLRREIDQQNQPNNQANNQAPREEDELEMQLQRLRRELRPENEALNPRIMENVDIQARIEQLRGEHRPENRVNLQNNVQQQVIAINDGYIEQIDRLIENYAINLNLGNDRLFIEFRVEAERVLRQNVQRLQAHALLEAVEARWVNLIGEVHDDAIDARAGVENDVEELAQNTVRQLEALRNQNNELIAGAIDGTRETMEMKLAEIADLYNEWMDNYTMTEARLRHQLAVQGNLDDRNFRDEEFERALEIRMQERRRE